MRRVILGTAGHIDHGKTSLVRALTGVDTDRLPEEKRRGITIDLGFAALSLDGIDIGIVDVPGHEALVRNMLAGATGIDVVLLVVAADEGIMPQTREHLAIMELLEVHGAVVAITKADLVDAEWLDLVTADVCDVIAETRFAGARAVPVSSTTGRGLDELRAAISDAANRVRERSRADLFRLPVDRAFTVHGTGTVVTGTVWSGEVARDAHLWIMPAGMVARARGLQVHGHAREYALAGERVALALAVDRADIRRGDTLVADNVWTPTLMVTAEVRVLADAAKPLRHRQRVRFHLGTAEILARVAMLEREEIEPGACAWVQLRLEAPCIARAGDRFVLRSYSPVHTIAGGAIAEPHARKRKRLNNGTGGLLSRVIDRPSTVGALDDAAFHTSALDAAFALAGTAGVVHAQIPLLIAGDREDSARTISAAIASGTAILAGSHLFARAHADAGRTAIIEAVDAYHADQPITPGLPPDALRTIAATHGKAMIEWALEDLVADRILRYDEGLIARADFARTTDPVQSAVATEILAVLAAAGLEAPAIAELPPAFRDRKDILTILRYLESQRRVVTLTRDRFAQREVLEELVTRIAGSYSRGQDLTTSDLKAAVGVSRKYLIPILEFFDREGITRRNGEMRTWIGRPLD